jgi:hypothetical protein
MRIVIEPTGLGHRLLKRILAGMAEGRMADIMGKAERFGQILVEAKRARQGTADLGDFQAVGQPDPEMIAVGSDEYLRLVTKAPERDRVDDSVAVALERVARSPAAASPFGMEPAARARRIGSVSDRRPHLSGNFSIV